MLKYFSAILLVMGVAACSSGEHMGELGRMVQDIEYYITVK